MLDQYHVESALRRYEDLLRESQQRHLVNEALALGRREPGMRRQAKLLVGQWLVAIGRRMQASSGLQPGPGATLVLLAPRIECPPTSRSSAPSRRAA